MFPSLKDNVEERVLLAPPGRGLFRLSSGIEPFRY
jgi:hypothetical protein